MLCQVLKLRFTLYIALSVYALYKPKSSQSELMMTRLGFWPISRKTVIYSECFTWPDQWEAVEVRWVVLMQRSICLLRTDTQKVNPSSLTKWKAWCCSCVISGDPKETGGWEIRVTVLKPLWLNYLEVTQDKFFLKMEVKSKKMPMPFFHTNAGPR